MIGVPKTVYMIRRKSDGMYSVGGSRPFFTKNGKAWTSKAALSNHLALVVEQKHTPYSGCEIVVIVLNSEVSDTFSVSDWLDSIKERRNVRQAEAERRWKNMKSPESGRP